MDFGERTTGTRDEHYNLISVLYHALHGAENCDRYASDAEVAGDERLAGFFRETQAMHTQVAERAKGLLGILEPPPEFGVTPGDVRRGTSPDAPIAPPEELVPPDVTSPPGEERPERRGAGPTTPREEPPAGEERPERRTP
jgi:hypothetical protein